MKVVIATAIALFCITSQAGENADRIAELKAEIAQRQAVIVQMQKEGRPTGRFEMTVFRLQRELERLEMFE